MNINEAILKSDIILIEGENKVGKLTFSLFLSAIQKKQNITILSSMQKKLMEKRLQSIKSIGDVFINSIIEKSKLLCLKEDWEEIKYKYGFDFIIDDIKRIVKENKTEILILHRPDLMFAPQEIEMAKWYIEKVIDICNEFNTKLFITTDENTFVGNFCENFSDINFIIQKSENKSERIVKVKHTLFPLRETNFILIKKEKLLLQSKNMTQSLKKDPIPKTKDKYSILVVTNDEYLKKFHKYIFEKEFNLEFASEINEIISKLLKNPDIVIFNPQKDEIDTQVCETVKNENLDTKIIYISNKEYARTSDKMKLFSAGCYEMVPKNFLIEEYILLIEKITNNFFYSKKIALFPYQKVSKTKENFQKIINALYEERIYFTLIIGKTTDYEIYNKIRPNDIIYIDENNNINLCLIDINKTLYYETIKAKLHIEEEKIIEVIEWIDND